MKEKKITNDNLKINATRCRLVEKIEVSIKQKGRKNIKRQYLSINKDWDIDEILSDEDQFLSYF